MVGTTISMTLEKTIRRDAVVRYVKDVVSNVPAQNDIPVIQIETKTSQINDTIELFIKDRFIDNFGVVVSSVDIGAIEIDKSSEAYRQLMSVTKDVTTAQKIANQGGNLTAEPWILTGLNNDEERKGLFSMIDDVQITNSHIMVAGSMAVEDEGTKIVVYDYDGNQLLKLGGEDISSPDKLGSITGMAETENGFVAADGNMREIQFWAKDGTHVGAISTEDIFGVSYPWLEDMQLLDDGSLLIMLTQERDDGSANELMFFRLTGF